MTSTERIALLGTGLIGTSIAMAAVRVNCDVVGWDADDTVARLAAARGGFRAAATMSDCVDGAGIVLVCTPIPTIPGVVVQALRSAPGAVVSDVASVKSQVVSEVTRQADPVDLRRFVGGHPMGGSERSGPEHAAASIVDGIVWVLTPEGESDPAAVEHLERVIRKVGSHPVRMEARRHDRLVAIVSHLPQVASTTLMALAATEEANEPEILLLAAGGFRDLTRLAASSPSLWSDILLANRGAILEAIDLYTERLASLREIVAGRRVDELREAFAAAKAARLTLSAKPQVRAGVAVLQVQLPDRPGTLAQLTGILADNAVNIEDLQIVHSPEGGRGAVYVTVAAGSADKTLRVLADHGFDPSMLA